MTNRLQDRFGILAQAWLDAGISFPGDDSDDRYAGTVSFGDRTDELQLNQLYLSMERPLHSTPDGWDFGARFDLLFGTDAGFAQAPGAPQGHWDARLLNNRFYKLAIPQAFVQLAAPYDDGMTVQIGHFYTILGNESVAAPQNFFYSHSYAMQYGEPFTHTGLLVNLPVKPDVRLPVIGGSLMLQAGSVTGSATGGWDGVFDSQLGNWGFLGGLSWRSADEETSVSIGATSSAISEHDNNNWSLHSLTIRHDFTPALHYTFQYDHGRANKVVDGQNAEWYGAGHYLVFDIQDELSAGLRAEWFRDDDGFRVNLPPRNPTRRGGASNYFAITAGLKWTPADWLILRPSVRYDWNDGGNAFDDGRKDTQLILSTDLILLF